LDSDWDLDLNTVDSDLDSDLKALDLDSDSDLDFLTSAGLGLGLGLEGSGLGLGYWWTCKSVASEAGGLLLELRKLSTLTVMHIHCYVLSWILCCMHRQGKIEQTVPATFDTLQHAMSSADGTVTLIKEKLFYLQLYYKSAMAYRFVKQHLNLPQWQSFASSLIMPSADLKLNFLTCTAVGSLAKCSSTSQ